MAVGLVGFLDHYPHSSLKLHNRQNSHFDYEGGRVAELGSLSSGAKMAMKIFVKRVFTIFASNALFLRVITNLQNQLIEICNIYHVREPVIYVLAEFVR